MVIEALFAGICCGMGDGRGYKGHGMDISTTTLNFELAGEVQLEYMAGVEERP
jgi:hypothetical protein